MKLSEAKLRRMKALSNDRGVIAAAAMDQRGSLQKSLAVARGVDLKQITTEMMSEFKVVVSKVLTPHASAILLDPEFGLDAARARSKNAGLLLAYELSGYDNTRPGRLPDLLPHLSVKRIVDYGADAVKILIYYSPFDETAVNDVKHAFIERIGAECETYDIPFFGVRRLRSERRRRESARLRQTEARDRKAQHGGVLETGIPCRRFEGGSPHQRGLRRRLECL